MSVHDAEPGDIYTDDSGKLWRIIGVCHEPTVTAEEVEGTLYDPNAPTLQHFGAGLGVVGNIAPQRSRIEKRRIGGGTGGLMWKGWQRIWRNDWRGKQPPMPVAEGAAE